MRWWCCAESSNRKNTNKAPDERGGGFGKDGADKRGALAEKEAGTAETTGAADKRGALAEKERRAPRRQRTDASDGSERTKKEKRPLWAFFYSDYFWWNPNCRRQMERHAEKASNRKSAESKR